MHIPSPSLDLLGRARCTSQRANQCLPPNLTGGGGGGGGGGWGGGGVGAKPKH